MDKSKDRLGGTKLDHRMEMGLCDKYHLIKYLNRSRAMGLDLLMVKPTPMDFHIDHNSPIRYTDQRKPRLIDMARGLEGEGSPGREVIEVEEGGKGEMEPLNKCLER